MSEKMEKPQVDIEAIMEEIREEVRKKGPYEPIPGLDDIPTSVLRKTDWTVSCAYPAEGGNPLKRLYTKLVSKVVRCALFPLTNRKSGRMRNRCRVCDGLPSVSGPCAQFFLILPVKNMLLLL